MTAAERQSWEQQPGESAVSFKAFRLYRDFGPDRSLDKVWQKYTRKRTDVSGRWQQWSRENQWVARAEAWDVHRERIEQEEIDRQLKRLARRRIITELRHQDRLEDLLERVDKVLKKAEKAPTTDTIEKTERKGGIVDPGGDGPKTVIDERTTIRRKGINFNGYARLIKELRAVALEAIRGVPKPGKPEEKAKEEEPMRALEALSDEDLKLLEALDLKTRKPQ